MSCCSLVSDCCACLDARSVHRIGLLRPATVVSFLGASLSSDFTILVRSSCMHCAPPLTGLVAGLWVQHAPALLCIV